MPKGVVHKFDRTAGYGFIRPEESAPDVFVHIRDLARGEDPALLAPGARVSFEVVQGRRGVRAEAVRVLQTAPIAISEGEFREELHSLLEDHALRVKNDVIELARRYGWVA